MGLDNTSYQVSEGMDVVKVCVKVSNTNNSCTCHVAFLFEVYLSIDNGTAGNITMWTVSVCVGVCILCGIGMAYLLELYINGCDGVLSTDHFEQVK